jgi:hypothetical protein
MQKDNEFSILWSRQGSVRANAVGCDVFEV